ncbi:MAG: helix-turn-helix transcriptional regulator [Clostridia bacterium]|nr:helix-turn-helix transcriptional regulator [Clostridia bacterium]
MKIDYCAIGMRIRRLRKEKNLTQEKLAEMAGQEPSNISHIERGATKLSLPTIVNIANALDVTVDELLFDSLKQSQPLYEKHVSSILSDCSKQETIVITETMLALKENIKKYMKNQNE